MPSIPSEGGGADGLVDGRELLRAAAAPAGPHLRLRLAVLLRLVEEPGLEIRNPVEVKVTTEYL